MDGWQRDSILAVIDAFENMSLHKVFDGEKKFLCGDISWRAVFHDYKTTAGNGLTTQHRESFALFLLGILCAEHHKKNITIYRIDASIQQNLNYKPVRYVILAYDKKDKLFRYFILQAYPASFQYSHSSLAHVADDLTKDQNFSKANLLKKMQLQQGEKARVFLMVSCKDKLELRHALIEPHHNQTLSGGGARLSLQQRRAMHLPVCDVNLSLNLVDGLKSVFKASNDFFIALDQDQRNPLANYEMASTSSRMSGLRDGRQRASRAKHYHDYVPDENAFQCFLLGFLAARRHKDRFKVDAEHATGLGRVDIRVLPSEVVQGAFPSSQRLPVIIECKYRKYNLRAESIAQLLEKAGLQITNMQYEYCLAHYSQVKQYDAVAVVFNNHGKQSQAKIEYGYHRHAITQHRVERVDRKKNEFLTAILQGNIDYLNKLIAELVKSYISERNIGSFNKKNEQKQFNQALLIGLLAPMQNDHIEFQLADSFFGDHCLLELTLRVKSDAFDKGYKRTKLNPCNKEIRICLLNGELTEFCHRYAGVMQRDELANSYFLFISFSAKNRQYVWDLPQRPLSALGLAPLVDSLLAKPFCLSEKLYDWQFDEAFLTREFIYWGSIINPRKTSEYYYHGFMAALAVHGFLAKRFYFWSDKPLARGFVDLLIFSPEESVIEVHEYKHNGRTDEAIQQAFDYLLGIGNKYKNKHNERLLTRVFAISFNDGGDYRCLKIDRQEKYYNIPHSSEGDTSIYTAPSSYLHRLAASGGAKAAYRQPGLSRRS